MITQALIQEHHDECETTKMTVPKGPWTTEPNRINFKSHGLDCMLVRHSRSLHWCGYVGVPASHPDFGKDWGDVAYRVHGGITYAKACQHHICHITDDPEDKTWWFGFDCAHAGDLSPTSIKWNEEWAKKWEAEHGRKPIGCNDSYRDVAYVKRETQRLAKQVAHRAMQTYLKEALA